MSFPNEIQGRMLYDNINNNLIIHGVQGTNPMSTRYSVYLFNIENQKEKHLNTMSYFNEKHKLLFIDNNKVLHYYKDFNKSIVYIYNLKSVNKPLSKKIENKGSYKIEYLFNNEKFIYFILIKQKDDYDDEKLIPDNELTFYKYNFNLDLIDTAKISYNAKIGFDKAIKVKSKLILYGFNEMVILRGKNSSDNKKEKNMISELFE